MNLERLQILIDVMKRVRDNNRSFNICRWQGKSVGNITSIEKEDEMCGTAACVGGWLAVSPEFKKLGGFAGPFGTPIYKGRNSEGAIISFLDCDYKTACLITGVGSFLDRGLFYGTTHPDASIVVDRLEKLYREYSESASQG